MLHSIILCTVFAFVGLGSISTLVAQSPGFVIYGTVRDMNTGDSIPFPTVLVDEVMSKAPPMPVVTTARGRYEIALTEQQTYVVRYCAAGKVTKSVQLELHGASDEDWADGFGMNIDVTLLDSLPGMDWSLLSEPFGIARFNTDTGNYEWDIDHTRSKSDRQKALLNTYRERMKNEAKGQ